MKNRLIKFSKLLVLAALAITLTSCEYFVDVDFDIVHPNNDTLTFIGWSRTGKIQRDCPFTSQSGDVHDNRTISFLSDSGGPSTAITEEQAFAKLMYDFDSVMLTRHSDGASTIVFRHDENATDKQRYFFTREAWRCDPEDETEKSRTYTLILPEMGCFK